MLNRVRQLKKESSGIKSAGFTIIEVMIVLAIAGLIMAIVFLAIPALQRNNRNTQRKADASRLAGLISDYSSSNNGALPTDVVASIGSPTWSIMNSVSITATIPGTAPAPDTAVAITGAKCGATPGAVPASGTSRQFVIYYGLEGGTVTQCLEV